MRKSAARLGTRRGKRADRHLNIAPFLRLEKKRPARDERLISIFLGGYFWVRTRLPSGSTRLHALALSMVPLLLIVILLLDLAVKAVKSKATYPRTGFVSYKKPQDGRKRKTIFRLVTIFAWSLIFHFLRSDALPGTRAVSWIPLLTGLFFAGTSVWIGIKTSVPRFYFTAAISALAGIILSVTGIEENAAFGFYWGILGISFCLSGGAPFSGIFADTRPPPWILHETRRFGDRKH